LPINFHIFIISVFLPCQYLFPDNLNVIDSSVKTLRKLKTENQKQRDEINLLKGEQGKPDIPSSTVTDTPHTKCNKACI